MGSLSDYAEGVLLNHILANTAYSPAATVYLGLSTADPLDTAAGLAEPVGNGYIRKAITFGVAANRAIAQNAVVTFDQASGAWGNITHYGVFDAEAAGNMLAHGSLSSPKQVVAGNTPSVASGQVTVTFNAGGIITSAANALLDRMFRNQAYAQPVLWVGLSTASPTDTGTAITTATEPTSAAGYLRVSVTVAGSFTSVTTAGVAKNSASLVFPTPSATWGTIGWAFLAGTSVVGSNANVLFYATVATQEPSSADTVIIGATALEVTMS